MHMNSIEKDGNFLRINVGEKITLEDYKNHFLPLAQNIIGTYGAIRILLNFLDVKGWDLEAAKLDLLTTAKLGKNFVKLAFVNPSLKEKITRQTLSPFIGGDIRFFEKEELPIALQWIKTP